MESAAVRVLALLGLTAVAVCAALLCARPLIAALDGALKKWRRLGIVPRVVVVLMAAVATVEAQKKCSNVGMSECSNVNDSLSTFKHSNIQTFKHYFSLKQVITNDSYFYSKPASAVRYPNWWLRGGYEDVFKLDFGNFRFPIGTNLVDYLWVYIWGKVRPRLKAKELEIDAIGAPMSAVPQVSEFWHTDGTNGSKILTWHNFFIGRIPLSESSVVPISAQLELFPNGDYIARSNLVERYYKRVNPDDWDEDGIPNDIDANPSVSDGDFFGPDNDLPEGANSNNYCWVEVAVSNANSLVTFIGDRPSNLPDPRFIAKTGVKYRVNLLIGKTYRVTSAQPIICTAKSCEDINVDQDDERSMTIVWPVSYEIVDNTRSVSRHVRLIPPLVGMYTWNTNTCCGTEKPDGPYIPSCAPDCTCEGGCDTGGFTFSYEGYSLDFSGVECGCKPNEEDDDEMKTASVSVSFSRQAIIYEETYETAPGITVPLRSTGSVLTCSASGGPKGGIVEFTLDDGNRLAKSGGSFPYTKELAPGEEVSFEINCTGQAESSSEDDIVVTGIFTENETGEMLAAEDRLTIVRVEFLPKVLAPNNPCIRRHKYGVRESVGCYCQPNLQNIQWRNVGSGNFKGSEYVCSLDADERPIEVRCKNAEYIPLISVVTPNGIEAVSVDCVTYGVPTNYAGGIGMEFKLRLNPLDVCFSGIAVEEVPCDIGLREGYFAMPIFAELQSHTRNNGAGVWCEIDIDNIVLGGDIAAIESLLPRVTPDGILTNDLHFGWMDGRIEWEIPLGWGEQNSSGTVEPFKNFADGKKAEMRLFEDGRSGVRKFQHQIMRYINGDIYLDMRKVEQ